MPESVLIVFQEPTPYVMDLNKHLNTQSELSCEIYFLRTNVSQQWDINLSQNCKLLKGNLLRVLVKVLLRRYDFVHLNGWSNVSTLLLMLVSWLSFVKSGVSSDTQLPIHISKLKRFVKRILYPAMFKLPSVCFGAGSKQADYFRHYGVKSSQIVIDQMTVDITSMQKASGVLADNAFQHLPTKKGMAFLFVGRLIERKGLRQLLAVFSQKQFNDASLWFVGGGELESNVRNAAAQNENIHYFGRLEGQALLAVYKACDVFVLPAHHEPWGLVINEAMAFGKPVIVTDTVGCADDLVINGKTGLIIPANDQAALENAMRAFVDKQVDYDKMSQATLQHISTWTMEDQVRILTEAWGVQ